MKPRIRRLPVCVSAGLLLFTSQASAAVPTVDRQSGCHVLVPDAWIGGSVQWIGGCPGGTAAGLGVAVDRLNGKLRETFFGDVTAGRMARGVIETENGYRVVRFVAGDPMATDSRQEIIVGFRVAAEAARQASAQFKVAGNSASARYYADAADRLANQLD